MEVSIFFGICYKGYNVISIWESECGLMKLIISGPNRGDPL